MQSGLNPPSGRLARETFVWVALPLRREKCAETRDRTGDLQIFSLTLSQLSYRGSVDHLWNREKAAAMHACMLMCWSELYQT